MPDLEPGEGILVESICGMMTGEPLVQMTMKGARVQFSPEEARDLALNLLQAAEASLADTFLVEFAMDKFDGDAKRAAVLLKLFRDWRQAREDVKRDA